MDSLFALGLVLIIGLSGGLLSRRLGLPSITGYVVVGLLMGPTVLGIVNADAAANLNIVTSICLGVIAYLIGTSLRTKTLRTLGKSIAWITLLEAIGAFVAVAAVLILVTERFMPGYPMKETYIPFALVMAASAAATAPAAVLAIVRECRAKGPLTSTLLAVVALDDAVAVILFALAMAVGGLLAGTGIVGSIATVALTPLVEIVAAIGLGCALGFLAVYFLRLVRSREIIHPSSCLHSFLRFKSPDIAASHVWIRITPNQHPTFCSPRLACALERTAHQRRGDSLANNNRRGGRIHALY